MRGFETPAHNGLTHVIDKGLGPRAWEDVLETSGAFIDIVKLGWGTAYVTQNLQRKLDVLRAAGKPVVIGGTFLEAVLVQDKVDEYKSWLFELGLQHVEVSDGVIDLPRERKLELIADLARDFTVLSEVGSKDATSSLAPYQWVAVDHGGARGRRLEGDHRGARGRHGRDLPPTGEMRTGLSTRSRTRSPVDDSIFEAPTKASQAWFVKQFGPSVNLGNIPPDEVIPLETLRLGLRGDTLKEVLLGDRAGAPAS
jgi:phosphosulfolactate synthase